MNRSLPSRWIVAALFGVLAAVESTPANALPASVTPSISVEQAYDSNVFDDRKGNEKEDYILRIRPEASFAFPALDTAVNLILSAETNTYYNNSGLSKYPATWRAALSPLRPISFNPLFSMTPRGYYLETYDSSRRTQLVFSPEAPEIPPEIFQFARTHTRDYGASITMLYHAAPRIRTSLTGAFNQHEIITDNTGLTDYYTYKGDLSISYLPGPRSTIGIYGSASDTKYSNDLVSTDYSVGLQGTYALSESLRMEGRLGESFLRNNPGNGLPERTDRTPNARLSFTYGSRDFTATAWGSFGYSSGSSFGQTSRQVNAGLSLGDQFVKGWWWNVSGSYQENRSLDNQNLDNQPSLDRVSGNGTAEIRYIPTPWATLRLSGTFFREWSRDDSVPDLTKATAFLGVTMSKTYSMY